MQARFRATVADGALQFDAATDARFRRQLAILADGPVDVTVARWRNTRTDRQSRYYFGVIVPLLAEHCGYPKDEMHELLAFKFLREADDPVTGSPRRKHTPQTDTKEFAAYVDQCIYLATELGVYIPSPGEFTA